MRIAKAESEWRARYEGAPAELLSYVSARGLMIAALRYYHAARDRLEEATTVACRERATDLPVRAAIDAATRAALRKVDEEDEELRKQNKPTRAGLDRRNAFLSARTRILRDHRHAVQRSRVNELRALLSLEEARLDFARCADVVTDLAQLIAWRQDAWRRYTAEAERQAEKYGVPVRRYVPSKIERTTP